MENYVGEIRLFAGGYAPEGWVLCDGRTLDIQTYGLLFSLIGTQFGGNGTTTFNVPDLRGRVPVCQNNPAQTGISRFVVGQTGGAELVTVATPQIPSHTHSVSVNAFGTTNTPSSSAVLAGVAVPVQMYVPPNTAGTSYPMNHSMVVASGNGQSHNNIMPSMVLTYIIATTGIYPTTN